MTDARPMSTDVFLSKMLEACDDPFEIQEAIKAWLEGDWDGAMITSRLAEKEPAE